MIKAKLPAVSKVIYKSLTDFFSSPEITALCQINALSATVSTYFNGIYQQEQFENITTLLHLINSKLRTIESNKLDIKFLDSTDGKRIIGKIFRSIARDNRFEKINAMSNLTVNLYVKSKLTIDEKDVYVDILDDLNVLQLSILQNAILKIKLRTSNQHRGFGWEQMQKEYESKGITGALLLQSIRALESTGLVNQNSASIQEEDKTHFVTFFGEQFYEFISNSPDLVVGKI